METLKHLCNRLLLQINYTNATEIKATIELQILTTISGKNLVKSFKLLISTIVQSKH